MSSAMTLILTWVFGLGLGTMFYGGLWWTLRKALASRRAALWFAGSLLARMALAVAGFYFVSGGQWQRLLICLLGFLMARAAVTRLTLASDSGNPVIPEAGHAS